MRIVISISDEVHADAERLAIELRISLRDLYRRAIREYVARHSPDRLTEAMNHVIEEVGDNVEEFN